MMRLHQERDSIVAETLDDPKLPQRLRAIELLRHDPARERLQLSVVARVRHSRVPHVVGEIEVGIVDPDRPVHDRYPHEPLAIARYEVEARGDVRPQAIDV